MALSLPDAAITAIDLSSASLAYAIRMARQYAVSNIEFVQMDLRNVKGLGIEFDFVQSSGVLHHLEDPAEGWERLVEVLRPRGLMRIGLYSELARQRIATAQIRARESRLSMRAFRQELLRERDNPESGELLLFPEFYSASGCRDLLFHVQERRYRLPQIRDFLARHNLAFLGFLLRDPAVFQQFEASFPRAAATDLDAWDAFENIHPQTFRHLYCFYSQKSD